MIYLKNDSLLIRDMIPEDAEIITQEEIAQGWHQDISKYLTRLEHQKQGLCLSLVAEYLGQVAGYINLYIRSVEGPFGGQNLPQIVDFGVLEKYRRRGIGSALMDQAERLAAQYADRVYLSVGLHSGYGSAQRMYAKRGYIPDGSGVWQAEAVCPPYGPCQNDDDLMLYLSKSLTPSCHQRSFILGMITAFCECVAAGCKKMALSPPLRRDVYEAVREEADQLIQNHGLLAYHEHNLDLPERERFEWIVIASKQTTLDEYQALRAQGLNPKASLKPFWNLLSYDPEEAVWTGYDAYRSYFPDPKEG